MSTPTVPRTPLAHFQSALFRARLDLADKRRRNDSVLPAARTAVLCALEAYVAELEARRLPIPYALRDELRIQQRVPAEHLVARGPAPRR